MYIVQWWRMTDDGWRRQCTTWYHKLSKLNHMCFSLHDWEKRKEKLRTQARARTPMHSRHTLIRFFFFFQFFLKWNVWPARQFFREHKNFLFRFIHTRVSCTCSILLLFDAHLDLDRLPNYCYYYCLPKQIKSDYITSNACMWFHVHIVRRETRK